MSDGPNKAKAGGVSPLTAEEVECIRRSRELHFLRPGETVRWAGGRPLDWYGPEDHDGYADPTDEIARVAAQQAEWDAAHSLSARMAPVWQFGFKTYLRIKNVMENLSS